MFHRVIWATDGSELAQRALPLAVDLATDGDGELVALHVDELIVGFGGAYPVRADEPELRHELEKQVTALRASGVNARLVIEDAGVVGTAQAIADTVELLGGDVVVVGTHGRGAVAGAVLGSVAKALLHKARCPVLAVPVLRMAERTTPKTAGAAAAR